MSISDLIVFISGICMIILYKRLGTYTANYFEKYWGVENSKDATKYTQIGVLVHGILLLLWYVSGLIRQLIS